MYNKKENTKNEKEKKSEKGQEKKSNRKKCDLNSFKYKKHIVYELTTF